MNFVPRNDVVLIRLASSKELATKGGVVLPDASTAKHCLVVAVGPDVKDLSPGDEIIAGGNVAEVVVYPLPLWVDDRTLHCIRQKDVMLVVKKDG